MGERGAWPGGDNRVTEVGAEATGGPDVFGLRADTQALGQPKGD